MAALVILLLFLALAATSLSGRTADSRDDRFTLGSVMGRRFRTGP